MSFINKHINLTQANVDILDDIIKDNGSINNYSEAIRYCVHKAHEKEEASDLEKNNIEKKLNIISKNVELTLEMAAGGFHEQGVKAITGKEDTYIYNDAKKNIERSIQRSVTKKSQTKNQLNKEDKKEDPFKINF